jgi:hypothetical protein
MQSSAVALHALDGSSTRSHEPTGAASQAMEPRPAGYSFGLRCRSPGVECNLKARLALDCRETGKRRRAGRRRSRMRPGRGHCEFCAERVTGRLSEIADAIRRFVWVHAGDHRTTTRVRTQRTSSIRLRAAARRGGTQNQAAMSAGRRTPRVASKLASRDSAPFEPGASSVERRARAHAASVGWRLPARRAGRAMSALRRASAREHEAATLVMFGDATVSQVGAEAADSRPRPLTALGQSAGAFTLRPARPRRGRTRAGSRPTARRSMGARSRVSGDASTRSEAHALSPIRDRAARPPQARLAGVDETI